MYPFAVVQSTKINPSDKGQEEDEKSAGRDSAGRRICHRPMDEPSGIFFFWEGGGDLWFFTIS